MKVSSAGYAWQVFFLCFFGARKINGFLCGLVRSASAMIFTPVLARGWQGLRGENVEAGRLDGDDQGGSRTGGCHANHGLECASWPRTRRNRNAATRAGRGG